jgi:hypothetical protein
MIERELNPQERQDIEARMRASGPDLSDTLYLALSLAGGALVSGVLALLFGALLARLADATVGVAQWWVYDFPRMIGWGAGMLAALLGVIEFARDLRHTRSRRAALQADLAAGRVEEEQVGLSQIWRVREEEHSTELLLLRADDGRIYSLIDDSTADTEGRGPKRSKLRLAERMYVVRYPASDTLDVRFVGTTIRRPPLLTAASDPRKWPNQDGWQQESIEAILSRIAPDAASPT